MASSQMIYELASDQFGVVTVEQLIACGQNKGQIAYQVKKGSLIRRKRGVLVIAGSHGCWEQEIAAATLAVRPAGAASHRSAARLWGFRTVDEHLEVSVRYPQRVILSDVIVHRSVDLTPRDVTWFEGLPVTTPERTLCDLGLVFPETEVMRILRHAVAVGRVNRRDVWTIRRRISKSGRDGAGIIGRCLDALPELAEYTESGLEVMFLEMCAAFGVPEPAIQLPVVAGGCHYRMDFAYPAQRVFVEIDGRSTHSWPGQIANDGARQNNLVAAGWQPLRFMYEGLRDDPSGCANMLLAALVR